MNMVFLGSVGSDAPGIVWIWNGHAFVPVRVPGWEIDSLIDVTNAIDILSRATRLKTPGLAESVTKGLSEMVTKELTQHLGDQIKGGGVIVVNAH